MPFDPKSYLAEKEAESKPDSSSNSFDPKAYLAEKEGPGFLERQVQNAADLGKGIVHGGTLGFADEIKGGGQTYVDNLKEHPIDTLTDSVPLIALYKHWKNPEREKEKDDQFLKDYRANQQESHKSFEESKARSPWLYGTGDVLGAVGVGALTAGAGMGARGAVSLGRGLVNAGVTGAVGGAVQAAGDSEGNLDDAEGMKKLGTDTAIGGATGAVLGPVIHGGIEGVKAGVSGVGGWLEKSPYIQKILASKKLGEQGVKLGTDEAAYNKLSGIAQDHARELGDKLASGENAIGKQIGDVISEKGHLPIDIGPEARDVVYALRETPGLRDLKDKLQEIGYPSTRNLNPWSSLDEAVTLKDRLAEVAKSSADPDVKRLILGSKDNQGILDSLKQKVYETAPELQGLYKQFNSLRNAGSERLISKGVPEDLSSAWIGSLKNAPEKVYKATDNMLENYTSHGGARKEASQTVESLMDGLKGFEQENPGFLQSHGIDVNNLQNDIRDKANISDVINDINGRQHSATAGILQTAWDSVTKGTPYRVANAIGRSSDSKAGAVVNLAKDLYSLPTQGLKSVAERLNQSGMNHLGDALLKNLEGNSQMKNSILFSIMQNPKARLALGSNQGSEDVK